MARVTVEDCLARIPNRFALTIIASRRARSLSEGRGRAMVECDNKEGVTALREISAGHVRYKEDVTEALVDFIEERRRQLRVTSGEYTFLEAASLRALEDDDDLDDDDDDDDDPATEAGPKELPVDPEALNKEAKKNAEGEDEESRDSQGEGFLSDDDGDLDGEEEDAAEGDDASGDEDGI